MFEDFHHDEAMHSGSESTRSGGGEEQSSEMLLGFNNIKV